MGHEIPDKWWGVNADREAGDLDDGLWHGQPEIRALSARHWRTIREVDALVLIGAEPWARPQKFTGANVEVGYALALGKPVFILGRVKRSAMYSDCLFAETAEDLAALLACVAGEDRLEAVA